MARHGRLEYFRPVNDLGQSGYSGQTGPNPNRAAETYDAFNAWAPSDDFYLGLVMEAKSVLDVGCGTGTLLHRARRDGHNGRLCGLDPDPAMLQLARRRRDIEWVLSDAASARFDGEFDLALMASHAFQNFITDDDLRASLAAIRTALVDGGRFAFETRNPLVRAWESWNPGNPFEVVDADGTVLRADRDQAATSRIHSSHESSHAPTVSRGGPGRLDHVGIKPDRPEWSSRPGLQPKPLRPQQRLELSYFPSDVPVERRSSHAWTTRLAMPSSASLPQARGSYAFLLPTSPSTFSTPS